MYEAFVAIIKNPVTNLGEKGAQHDVVGTGGAKKEGRSDMEESKNEGPDGRRKSFAESPDKKIQLPSYHRTMS